MKQAITCAPFEANLKNSVFEIETNKTMKKTLTTVTILLLASTVLARDHGDHEVEFTFSGHIEAHSGARFGYETYNEDLTRGSIIVMPSMFNDWSCNREKPLFDKKARKWYGTISCVNALSRGFRSETVNCHVNKRENNSKDLRLSGKDDSIFVLDVSCKTL